MQEQDVLDLHQKMPVPHSNQNKKMMSMKHYEERHALRQQEIFQTAYLEEMGISVLCSLSSGDSKKQPEKKLFPQMKQDGKGRKLKKKSCTWPHAMLISFIDLAKISEMSRREKKDLSSSSTDIQSFSDFDAETEREHESETDTDTDCVEMELDTLRPQKSQWK